MAEEFVGLPRLKAPPFSLLFALLVRDAVFLTGRLILKIDVSALSKSSLDVLYLNDVHTVSDINYKSRECYLCLTNENNFKYTHISSFNPIFAKAFNNLSADMN